MFDLTSVSAQYGYFFLFKTIWSASHSDHNNKLFFLSEYCIDANATLIRRTQSNRQQNRLLPAQIVTVAISFMTVAELIAVMDLCFAHRWFFCSGT
jgi:hypothetical protein